MVKGLGNERLGAGRQAGRSLGAGVLRHPLKRPSAPLHPACALARAPTHTHAPLALIADLKVLPRVAPVEGGGVRVGDPHEALGAQHRLDGGRACGGAGCGQVGWGGGGGVGGRGVGVVVGGQGRAGGRQRRQQASSAAIGGRARRAWRQDGSAAAAAAEPMRSDAEIGRGGGFACGAVNAPCAGASPSMDLLWDTGIHLRTSSFSL